MKNGSKNDDGINVSFKLVSDTASEEGTLSQAKSRGYVSCVFALDNVLVKDKVLSDIIHLCFTIRIHHKCKIIVDLVRVKVKVFSK